MTDCNKLQPLDNRHAHREWVQIFYYDYWNIFFMSVNYIYKYIASNKWWTIWFLIKSERNIYYDVLSFQCTMVERRVKAKDWKCSQWCLLVSETIFLDINMLKLCTFNEEAWVEGEYSLTFHKKNMDKQKGKHIFFILQNLLHQAMIELLTLM